MEFIYIPALPCRCEELGHIKCGKPTEVERRMAEVMGIDPEQVHAIMDLFEELCDKWLDETDRRDEFE